MANEQTRISLRRLATFLAKLKDIFASKSDLANKQDKLKWDSTPTSGSSNPVTSDGVSKAIESAKSGLQPAGAYATTDFVNSRASLMVPINHIPANSDLNDKKYSIPGTYCYGGDTTARTIKNAPSNNSGLLKVYSVMDTVYGEVNTPYAYRFRIFYDYKGNIYFQPMQTDGNKDKWKNMDWRRLAPIQNGHLMLDNGELWIE